MNFKQELTVLPADNPGRSIGWMVKETLGVSVINEWPFLPWYKKMLRGRFYTDLWRRLFQKRREEYYGCPVINLFAHRLPKSEDSHDS
jgi:uncharacterized membrane protein